MAIQMEAGHQCPITMTNAAVPTLLLQPEIAQWWVPKVLARDYDKRFKPAADKRGVTIVELEPLLEELADVADRLPRAPFVLRDGESVVDERRRVIAEAVRDALLQRIVARKEVRLEPLLRHGRRDAVAPRGGQGVEHHRRVHVALMVGREDHRVVEPLEVLEPLDGEPRVDIRRRESQRRQQQPARRARGKRAVPGREDDPGRSR